MEEINITKLGNPGNPTGEYGKKMLLDMNEHHSEVTNWALSLWKIKESDKVLDIGCGGGKTLKTMSESVKTGKLYGVDYSETALATCKEYNQQLISDEKLELVNASVEKMPFKDNFFQKIITVESFYFWPNPATNLKEVLRVLKPGGTFLLVADIYGDSKLTDKDKQNIQEYNLYNPTRLEFLDLFVQAGYADVSVHLQRDTTWICVEGKK